MTGTERQFEHERYEELCALATTGNLTPAESVALFTHLDECAECSAMFAEYQDLATDGMDLLRREFTVSTMAAASHEDRALRRLMEEARTTRPHLVSGGSHWKEKVRWGRAVFTGLMAASLLCVVGAGCYWIGSHSNSTLAAGRSAVLDANSVQASADRQILEKVIQTDNQHISVLERQADGSRSELQRLRADAASAAGQLARANAVLSSAKAQSDAQIAALTQSRDAAAVRLQDAEARYQAVQAELSILRSQHQQDLLRMASLQNRTDTLSASLRETVTRARSAEEFLSADRDIRDLIGARNLYIADIMDVDDTGLSRKPFGRVFYTKTRSLIFYAYDLDRQPGVLRTSTFQVWGRTGADDRKPMNLGILYMDSRSNRRWTLRVDNPQQLAKLDAVFVTIEPHPQAERPTGKPFLYASLRREPNHP